MFHRSAVRRTLALAFAAGVVACGDSGTLGPDATSPFPVAPPQGDVIEALITFQQGGGNTSGPNPPSFSLSTVPTSTVEDVNWGRSGIAVDPHGPFAPSMAVDYGDGTGVKTLSVQQSGGGYAPPGSPPPPPATYSFNLSHKYANPGTYTVTVAAETYTDSYSSRVETRTVTVTQDLNLYIEDFQIAEPVVQGTPAAYSFRARGPGSTLYTVKVSYGTNLIQTSAVAPGGTYTNSYAWAEPGTYTLKAIISNETHADTLTRSVVVQAIPITLTAFDAIPESFAGTTWPFSFSVDALAPGPYTVTFDFGDGTEPAVFQVPPGGSASGEHTWAESGLYEIALTLSNAYTGETIGGEIPVYGPRPSIDDLQMPETLSFGEPSEIVFVANDPNGGTQMAYELALFVGGEFVQQKVPRTETTAGETIHIPIQAPNFAVEIDLVFSIYSLKNGLIMADTLERRLSIVQTTCVAGTYKSGFECVPAPVGYFVPDDEAEEATACAEGTYQDQQGQTSCIPAPMGSYVDVTGAAQAALCPVGTYQDQEGQTSCIPAPAGSFVGFTGAAQPELCPAGTYQSATGSSSCEPALPGFFVSGVGQTEAQLCEPGTYSDVPGAAACDDAPQGSYVSGSGATQATKCELGTFQALSGQTGCTPAPAGSYVDVIGASQATPCAPGTFQTATGSTSCDLAPLGSFVSGHGQTEAQLCAPGTYSDVTGAAACQDAPAGSFVADAGSVQATKCAVGTYQALSGQTGCTPAPAGSYVDVIGASQATPCAPGTYQPAAGSTGCLDAPAGSAVPVSGATQAALCAVGTFQAGTGQLSCDLAPIGTYVDIVGASAATACPAGTSTEAAGSTSADACVALGVILVGDVQQAIADGTLVPMGNGNGAAQQMQGWLSDLQRSVSFLAGRQKQAGCVGVRNALAKADGKPSPKDQVTGPARADVAAALQRILDESGCGR